MNIYDKKYAEFNKMSKHELIEYILDLTPYKYEKNGDFNVIEDGTIIIGVDIAKMEDYSVIKNPPPKPQPMKLRTIREGFGLKEIE